MSRHSGLPAVLLVTLACTNSSGLGGGVASACTPSATLACVTIQDFTFSPASLTIKAGTVVRWTNNGPSTHTASSNADVWTSGNLNPPTGGGTGGSYQFTFTTPGTYGYFCYLHPPSLAQYAGFTGTITVTP